MSRGARFVPPFVVLLSLACTIPGAGWETTSLKQTAATDLACDAGGLTTYEAGAHQYTVRGCGKRARYIRQQCDRVNRTCIFALDGEVMADGASATSGGTPSDVTIPPR